MTDKPCRSVADSGTEKSHFEDEALEAMWELRELDEGISLNCLMEELGNKQGIQDMQGSGLITIDGNTVGFTGLGERRARDIVRRHRLAERLFADVLDLSEYEEDACRFEHAISPGVEEAICTLLGHPPVCPHGKPIPKGRCCELFTRKVKPLVQSLRDMEVGKSARVLLINSASVDRLASMGLMPGTDVHLVQKKPSIVLKVHETTLAIDEEIAKGIFVRQY